MILTKSAFPHIDPRTVPMVNPWYRMPPGQAHTWPQEYVEPPQHRDAHTAEYGNPMNFPNLYFDFYKQVHSSGAVRRVPSAGYQDRAWIQHDGYMPDASNWVPDPDPTLGAWVAAYGGNGDPIGARTFINPPETRLIHAQH